MRNQRFSHTDPDLVSVLEQLRLREPIFHTPEFGSTRTEFEKATALDYWETSASGRRYSREFILSMLEQHPPVDATAAGWHVLYHQGTVVSAEEDDTFPASWLEIPPWLEKRN